MANKLIVRSLSCFSVLAIVVAFVISAAAQTQPTRKQRNQAKDLIEKAEKEILNKNYRSAVGLLDQSIGLVQDDPRAHFRKGYAHYFLKEYPEAISELDTAQRLGYDKQLDIFIVRAYAKYESKDFDGALADIREVLKLQPDNADFILKEADINSAKGNDREALAAYQKAVAQNPRDANLYFRIAEIQFKLGDTAAQVSAAEEAIKRNTLHLGDAYYIAADGYLKQKRYEEAEQAFSRAIDRWKAAGQKKQEMYIAYRSLADIYRRLNRFNDAIRVSRQALGDFANDGTIYTDLSWYYSLADRHQDAIDAAIAGIRLSSEPQLAYTNLCRAYNDTAQYQLAINACNAALKLAPDDGETHFYLGRAYDLTNRPAEATKAYDKAVRGLEKFTRENPDYSDGFYLLGNAYFADGQRDKAITAYRQCLDLSPRFVKARFNLGIIYALNKNKTAAMEQYNSLLALDQTLAAKLKTEIDKL